MQHVSNSAYCLASYLQENIIKMPFLYATSWILSDRKSIVMVIIYLWRSTLRQFVCARTINEHDVTITAPCLRVTSQVKCGDVKMVNQKTVLGEISDRWFFLADLCVQEIKEHVKNNVWVTMHNDFFCHLWGDLAMIFTNNFITHENHCWIASLVAKIVIHGNPYIIL